MTSYYHFDILIVLKCCKIVIDTSAGAKKKRK